MQRADTILMYTHYRRLDPRPWCAREGEKLAAYREFVTIGGVPRACDDEIQVVFLNEALHNIGSKFQRPRKFFNPIGNIFIKRVV